MNWKKLLAHITGSVDQELLVCNEYLATENRILRNQLKGRLRLTDPERMSLAEIGKRLGRRALEEVAQIVRPETILGWHRRLVARKFDGSKSRSMLVHETTGPTIEDMVNHQGKGNVILFPAPVDRIGESSGEIHSREGLGGLLRFYFREAALAF